MLSYYSMIALDIARERAAEAAAARLAASVRPARRGPGPVRRAVSRIAVAIARAADREGATMALRAR